MSDRGTQTLVNRKVLYSFQKKHEFHRTIGNMVTSTRFKMVCNDVEVESNHILTSLPRGNAGCWASLFQNVTEVLMPVVVPNNCGFLLF
jgi:hypothetical protein